MSTAELGLTFTLTCVGAVRNQLDKAVETDPIT